MADSLVEERLTGSIIGSFYSVYWTLGFGFLEHVYVLALERELRARGHRVAREVSVDIMYLRATKLEVGLLLHFGAEPEFYRLYCPHSSKR